MGAGASTVVVGAVVGCKGKAAPAAGPAEPGAGPSPAGRPAAAPASWLTPSLATAIAALERNTRLGVAVLDTGTGVVIGHRLDERFAMCSTFKVVLAAQVLERAATGGLGLDTAVTIAPADLVHHAPVTEPMVKAATARGLAHATATVGELARATQLTSDNPAANVLVRHLGGPAALTAYCRGHGDPITRIDRYEPAMNDWAADDARDTTSPRAKATLLARLLYGGGLPAPARDELRAWMIATETGLKRLRAGLPATWAAGDKTGTMAGDGQTTKINDVGWVEPSGRAPLVIAAYLDTQVADGEVHDADQAVLASVGRLIAAAAG